MRNKISAVHALAVGTPISGRNGLLKAGVQLLQLSLGQIRRSGAMSARAMLSYNGITSVPTHSFASRFDDGQDFVGSHLIRIQMFVTEH